MTGSSTLGLALACAGAVLAAALIATSTPASARSETSLTSLTGAYKGLDVTIITTDFGVRR